MGVLSFTSDYIKYVMSSKLATEELRANYEAKHFKFFNHYFTYWASRENIPQFLKFSNLTENLIKSRSKKMIYYCEKIQKKFKKNFKSKFREFELIIFVGVNTSNGHAFKDKNNFKVWLPLETYTTEKQMKIFITHEIAHALHYTLSPNFYFKNKKEKLNISRQIVTEGIATYLTMIVNNTDEKNALWADYLSKAGVNQWYKLCKQNEKLLYQNLLTNFNSSSSQILYFSAADSNDILKYRAGYYCSLKIIQEIAKEMPLLNLLTLDKKILLKKTKDLLKRKIN